VCGVFGVAVMDNNYKKVGGAYAVDSGLRSYMISVFNRMFLGLLVTGVVSYACANSGLVFVTTNSVVSILLFVALLGISISIGGMIGKMKVDTVSSLFWVYAILMGLFLAPISLVYTGASICNAFFMTACFFGGMSLYGYTTNRDLTAFGSFLIVGVISLFLTSLVNVWLIKSNGLSLAISALTLIVFIGLTAYDVQKIKSFYNKFDESDVTAKKSIFGAFTLYLDFINIFLSLLRFVGNRK
jgi:FtsH-binding integral membrane protein